MEQMVKVFGCPLLEKMRKHVLSRLLNEDNTFALSFNAPRYIVKLAEMIFVKIDPGNNALYNRRFLVNQKVYELQAPTAPNNL
jgi:hypothetical protein